MILPFSKRGFRSLLPSFLFLFFVQALCGQTISVLRQTFSYQLPKTWMKDSMNIAHKSYAEEDLLTESFVTVSSKISQPLKSDAQGVFRVRSSQAGTPELLFLDAFLQNSTYTTQTMEIRSSLPIAVWMDGKCIDSQKKISESPFSEGDYTQKSPTLSLDLKLVPGTHAITFRVLLKEASEGVFAVSMPQISDYVSIPSATVPIKKHLDLDYMMKGDFLSGVSVSPSGNYALVKSFLLENDQRTYKADLYNKKGEMILSDADLYGAVWGTTSDELYYRKREGKQGSLWKWSLKTGEKNRLLGSFPSGEFMLSGNDQFIFLREDIEGDPKDEKVIRFRDPDDRQPSWRNREGWSVIDSRTGVTTPLFVGKENLYISALHPTTSKVLIASNERAWDQQPYSRTSFFEYDYKSGEVDTLLQSQASLNRLLYIPRTDFLLAVGTPNSFNGKGNRLAKGQMGNDFEGELFLWNRKTQEVIPLTDLFNPSVSSVLFADSRRVVFMAEDGSCKRVYTIDLSTKKIAQLPLKEDYIISFSLSHSGNLAWYYGHGATNADRLYRLTGKSSFLVRDLDQERMEDYQRPSAYDWSFKAEDGTPIEAWYYLPPSFDPNKKYPMLVYYYGGTTPTRRSMEGAYSLPMFASQDYIVLTLNPSGTIGYGQEFAARHLNAWGDPTANEIIDAVRHFCQEHPFVNDKKIGCFGASYGGFMTQYLQTKTDLFAAAISHAGISNITNYWGSGYWGMGYSEVAANGSFPWSDRNIYVDRSPLFNADKIQTPLLLLHGDSDTNVPTAESINMYNALKVLGKEVELVLFTGEDHFILEPSRKRVWTQTMFAWFQRFLKDDPSWWNDLYEDSQKK